MRRLQIFLGLAVVAACTVTGADVAGKGEAKKTEGELAVAKARVMEERRKQPPNVTERGSEKCGAIERQSDCRLANGCSWCSAGGVAASDKPSKRGERRGSPLRAAVGKCMPWRMCGGCEARNSSVTCQETWGSADRKPGGGTQAVAPGGAGKHAGQRECLWCATERRCLPLDAGGEEWGQCKGCDGVFDSGTRIDSCGICGGGCLYLTRQEAVGVSLALSGNLLISIALNMQKHAHNINEASSGGKRPYTSLPIWRFGMILMAVGETGNFLAYAYAPATLVAPLGSVSVISNVVLARYVLKEVITLRSLWGVFLAIVGSVLIVTFAPSSDQQLTMDVLEEYMSEKTFIVFVACIIAAAVGLFLLSDKYKRHYVVVYTLICSLTGCLTVMGVKGVSTALILTLEGHNQFFNFLPWVLLATVISTAIIQLKYLNLAMMHFGASEVVPVYYVLFTFFSIVGGIVLYKEYHQHCPPNNPDCHSTIYFLLGCCLTFYGVYLISFGKKSKPLDKELTQSGGSGAEAERDGLLSNGDDETIVGCLEDELQDLNTLPGFSKNQDTELRQLGGGRSPLPE